MGRDGMGTGGDGKGRREGLKWDAREGLRWKGGGTGEGWKWGWEDWEGDG